MWGIGFESYGIPFPFATHTHTHTHTQRERERERETDTHTHTHMYSAFASHLSDHWPSFWALGSPIDLHRQTKKIQKRKKNQKSC